MANIKAQATGNWSAGATWSGGVPPGVNDVGFSNGFAVTIDQDITCQAISNAAISGSSIAAGGGFTVSAGPRVLNCALQGNPTGFTSTSSAILLNVSAATTVTINGTIQSGTTTQTMVDMSTAGATVVVNTTNIGTNSSTGGAGSTYFRLNANNLTLTL